MTSMTSETSSDDVRLVANLFRDLGLDKEALLLWQKLSDGRMSYDTQELINCAGRLREDGVLLDTCKKLRENGVEDDQLLRLEIDLLQRYDPEAAITAIQRYVQKHPEDLSVRIRLSVLGLQSGRADVVSGEPANMPPASDVRPKEAVAAVWVLRSTGHVNEAVRYAYQVVRLHFDDAEAHRAYVSAMISTGPQPDISEPAAAGPGTAVNFVEEGATTEQWVVIEEEHPPDGKLGEISPDSSLANELKGKRPGDSFTLSKPRFGGAGRTATVKLVQSKFVYRYQDCLAQLEVRFPDVVQVQMVRLPTRSGPGGTPETDFGPIIEALKKKRERIADLEKIYGSQLCPIHLLAEAMGLNDLQVLAGLANNPDAQIRCCSGSAPERDDALKDLTGAKEIVIDLTAIATLVLLELTQLFRDSPIQLAVSPATLAELRRMASEARDSVDAKAGSLGLVGDRPNFVSYSKDFKRKEVEALDDLVAMLSNKCNVPSCEKLANLDPTERDEIVRLFGQNGAESIILASEPGRILWSDDQVLGEFAKARYSVKRVWTQVRLQSRMSSGALQPPTFFEAAAKLAGWGYFFTSVNPRSMMKGAELAKWNPTAWPIAGSLPYLSLDSVPVPEVIRLTVLFITGLYREDILPEQRTTLVVAMLESLAKRTSGVDLIRSIVGLLPRAFGVNAVRAAEAVQVVEAWLTEANHHSMIAPKEPGLGWS
jgi:transcription elongation GreA/GreB family factor